jgi:hypothetical protein
VKSKSRESGKCKVRECEGEGGKGWGTRGGGRDKARKSRQGKKIQAMHLRIFNFLCEVTNGNEKVQVSSAKPGNAFKKRFDFAESLNSVRNSYLGAVNLENPWDGDVSHNKTLAHDFDFGTSCLCV